MMRVCLRGEAQGEGGVKMSETQTNKRAKELSKHDCNKVSSKKLALTKL